MKRRKKLFLSRYQQKMIINKAKKAELINRILYNKLKNQDNCSVCKKQRQRRERLEIHHKIPLSKGGSNKKDNLIAICEKCHKKIHEV